MQLKELYNKYWQDGPILVKHNNNEWLILPSNENEAYFDPISGPAIALRGGWLVASKMEEDVFYLDRFVNGAVSEKHICTCDFYSVVLRSGCQCGGI